MSAVTAPRRVALLVGLVVLAVLAAVLGQPSKARHPIRVGNGDAPLQLGARVLVAPDAAARHAATPVASRLGAVSTTWFCGGGSPSSTGGLSTHLILVNRSADATTATIDFVSSSGRRHTTRVDVAGRTATSVDATGVGDAGSVAAVVEARGGGLVVSQRIGAGDTVTVAASATASSESWFFSGGDTQKGSSEQLVLFNPFDDLATADVSFLTADGFRHPQETQGLPVSARSLLVVDVAKVQNRRKDLASMVTTRAGRLVVWRAQQFDGSGPSLPAAFPPSGVSVSLGTSTALDHFVLPTAVTGQGVVTRIVLSNPGTVDATVRLGFEPDDPSTNGQPPNSSTKVSVGSVVVLGSARLRQIPAGVPFTVTGEVTKGGPVVAELWLDGAEPAKGHGTSAATAIPVAARQWVAPNGLRNPSLDQLGITAPANGATFTVSVVDGGRSTRVAGASVPRRVAAGGRVTVDLSAALAAHPGATVEVRASAPVVVSRLQAGQSARGLVTMAALPVEGTFSVP